MRTLRKLFAHFSKISLRSTQNTSGRARRVAEGRVSRFRRGKIAENWGSVCGVVWSAIVSGGARVATISVGFHGGKFAENWGLLCRNFLERDSFVRFVRDRSSGDDLCRGGETVAKRCGTKMTDCCSNATPR